MGQQDRTLRILVVDPDEAFTAELKSLVHAAVEIVFLPQPIETLPADPLTNRDVVVVGVDCSAGLALVADISGRAGAPPVIAVGGAGFDGKTLEHVLLLAELRGAAAALPKPIEVAELVLAAGKVVRREPLADLVRDLRSRPPSGVAA